MGLESNSVKSFSEHIELAVKHGEDAYYHISKTLELQRYVHDVLDGKITPAEVFAILGRTT